MKNAISIEKLGVEKWKDFKQIRLEAFATDPQAFSPTQVAEAPNYSEKKWKEYMTTREVVVLVAKDDNKIIGIIGSYKESDETAVIWGTYVNLSYRGKGIGKMLLHEIIKSIETDKSTKKIKLWVEENHHVAMSLYKKFGFDIFGKDFHLVMEKLLQ